MLAATTIGDPVLPTESHVETGAGNIDNVSARRQKKREIDRRCQRQARERTKSRIAHLESLVQDLQGQDAGGRIAALMRQLTKVEKERDALSQTLKEVQKAVLNHSPGDDQERKPLEDPKVNLPSDLYSIPSIHSVSDFDSGPVARTSQCVDTFSGPTTMCLDQIDTELHTRGRSSSFEGSPSSTLELEPIVPKATCECCRDEPNGLHHKGKNLWRYANTTLLERYNQHGPITVTEDLLSDDIAVRVLLEGWDAVEQRIGQLPSWSILRRIDDALFHVCSNTERLAILKTMHTLLQYHREPTPERYAKLPSWYLQRPSQTMPHSYAINYFVWPGLRERFVFYQHHYCSNLFWHLFSTSLHIQWPYSFRDCFVQRPDTGMYEIGPMFIECISDISRWAMRPDLFTQYPELRSDIPVSYSVPKPASNVLQLQMANAKTSNLKLLKASDRHDSQRADDSNRFTKRAMQLSSDAEQFVQRTWNEVNQGTTVAHPDFGPASQWVM